MDIDWMIRAEINLAIPPPYTEHIGHQLMAALHDTTDKKGTER